MTRLLSALTELFVNAFGLTRPRPDQQRRASLIIGSLTLAALVIILALIVGMLVWAFHA
jgi:hypothetical protein